jgi:PAS domain-containing protein
MIPQRRKTDQMVNHSEFLCRLEQVRSERMKLDSTIEHHLMIFRSFFDQLPIPAWIKLVDTHNRRTSMWRINASYGDIVGILPADYALHADAEVWSNATTDQFYEHDLTAINNGGEPVVLIETWPHPVTGEQLTGRFVIKRELQNITNAHGVYAVLGILTGIRDELGNEVWPSAGGGYEPKQ